VASPFQQQSLRRKIVYTCLILVLFFATLIFRQSSAFGLESQAAGLELREHDQGEVELTGSALRLSLSGARGAVVCFLWWSATEKQKKHEWNELEILVRSLTKLEPHFIRPWLFQSWNLAYNVSVECDRIRDKYFYITRGIELIGEGQRQNKNDPDLRYNVGFYNQHKLGVSDEANTFRCLFQMSCIDPIKRDPDRLRTRDKSDNLIVDPEKFEQFCREHPMLVRRLHDTLKKTTPTDIIDFLYDNRRIPSRFEDQPPVAAAGGEQHSELKPEEQRFPLLPPLDPSGRREPVNPDSPDFDNFTAARDWYSYSVEPLPPPTRELSMFTPPYDVRRYRMPRYMASSIFRGYPARGQSYIADYLEREGWFDAEGWRITDNWFQDDKFQDGSDAIIGGGVPYGLRAHEKAWTMWRDHGTATGLYLEPEELKSLEDQAEIFRKRAGFQPSNMVHQLPAEFSNDKQMQDGFKAHNRLYWYEHYRSMTNFPHFYFKSQVDADPKSVKVRKTFYQADRLRKAGDRELALEKYREAMPEWRQLMLDHPGFRQDSIVQEDTYEIELKYLDLVQALRGRRLRELLLIQDYLTFVAASPVGAPMWFPKPYFSSDVAPNVLTPFDLPDPEGKPLIDDMTMASVRQRLGLPVARQSPPMGPPGMSPGMR
jgi:hypothetical protein